jgi:hypothetical protein
MNIYQFQISIYVPVSINFTSELTTVLYTRLYFELGDEML